jgi:hypothetical protein
MKVISFVFVIVLGGGGFVTAELAVKPYIFLQEFVVHCCKFLFCDR